MVESWRRPTGRRRVPTTDRVREAIFNALGSAGMIEGALVADLFAGTGAVGIEALVHAGPRTARSWNVIGPRCGRSRRTSTSLDLADRTRVLRSDAGQAAATLDVDIAFVDPPYDFDGWSELLAIVRAPYVVAESGRAIDAVDGWEVTRSKRYGRTWVSFLERSAH